MARGEEAREAFLAAYAAVTAGHDVGLTTRAWIACEAAARVAEASPVPDPTPTLQLGQLEGVWAVIYARREAIELLHGRALKDVMAALEALDWDSVLDAIRTEVAIDPNITAAQLANLLGQRVENLISAALPASDRLAWQQSMTAALIDATAEGQAAATGLIATGANIRIDWNLAATEAKKALGSGQILDDQAAAWIVKQTHGLGYQVSRKLAALWEQGATRQEMLDAITEILGSSANNAALLLDTAVGQALSYGAMSTYDMAGVAYVDFVTAGDGRVCPACAQAEDENSYLLYSVPAPPLHPGCRCTLAPSDYQPTGAVLQMLSAYQDPALLDAEAA